VFAVVALLAVALALFSYRYLLPHVPLGAPNVLANRFVRFGALTIHAGFASTALLIGSFQFVPWLRKRWPRVHRWTGTTYVICCLTAGVAGLVLALGSTAGLAATLGFGSLAIVWILCTAQAWRFARARNFARHERWMIRSFALTLAAVTLRLYLPLAGGLRFDMGTAYQAISFLCWIPNLAIAELLMPYLQTLPVKRRA
jgi:uncharacterized membrane protein